jgi:excisionase family DNA binding protein
MNEEYMSFEQACKDLALHEDELKRLVSDGEIRGFRDKGQTIFKKEDVKALREAMSQQPVIVPSGEGEESPVEVESERGGEFEETVLNIEGLGDIDLGGEMTGPAVEATEKPAAPDEETFAVIDEDTEPATRSGPEKGMRDTIRMPAAPASEEEETFVLSESDLGDETESLELLDETSTVMGEQKAPGPQYAPQAGFAAPGMAYAEAAPADKLTVGLLIVTIAVMVVGLFASLGFLLQQSNIIVDLFAPVKA